LCARPTPGSSKTPARWTTGEVFEKFRETHHGWLYPYSLFWALKQHLGGKLWLEWPAEYRSFHAALSRPLPPAVLEELAMQEFCQFLFYNPMATPAALRRRQGH